MAIRRRRGLQAKGAFRSGLTLLADNDSYFHIPFPVSDELDKAAIQFCSCFIGMNHERPLAHITALPYHHLVAALKCEGRVPPPSYLLRAAPCFKNHRYGCPPYPGLALEHLRQVPQANFRSCGNYAVSVSCLHTFLCDLKGRPVPRRNLVVSPRPETEACHSNQGLFYRLGEINL